MVFLPIQKVLIQTTMEPESTFLTTLMAEIDTITNNYIFIQTLVDDSQSVQQLTDNIREALGRLPPVFSDLVNDCVKNISENKNLWYIITMIWAIVCISDSSSGEDRWRVPNAIKELSDTLKESGDQWNFIVDHINSQFNESQDLHEQLIALAALLVTTLSTPELLMMFAHLLVKWTRPSHRSDISDFLIKFLSGLNSIDEGTLLEFCAYILSGTQASLSRDHVLSLLDSQGLLFIMKLSRQIGTTSFLESSAREVCIGAMLKFGFGFQTPVYIEFWTRLIWDSDWITLNSLQIWIAIAVRSEDALRCEATRDFLLKVHDHSIESYPFVACILAEWCYLTAENKGVSDTVLERFLRLLSAFLSLSGPLWDSGDLLNEDDFERVIDWVLTKLEDRTNITKELLLEIWKFLALMVVHCKPSKLIGIIASELQTVNDIPPDMQYYILQCGKAYADVLFKSKDRINIWKQCRALLNQTRSNGRLKELVLDILIFGANSCEPDELTDILKGAEMKWNNDEWLHSHRHAMLQLAMLSRTKCIPDLTLVKELFCRFCNTHDVKKFARMSLKHESGFVGLTNLGQTSYMNASIQQLFHDVQMRRFILGQRERQSGSEIFRAFRKLMIRMSRTDLPVVDTTEFFQAWTQKYGDCNHDPNEFLVKLDGELNTDGRTRLDSHSASEEEDGQMSYLTVRVHLENKDDFVEGVDRCVVPRVCHLDDSGNLRRLELVGIIAHTGHGIHSHCTSYVKDRLRWLLFDDEHVSEVSETAIFGPLSSISAYSCLLFYAEPIQIEPKEQQDGNDVGQILEENTRNAFIRTFLPGFVMMVDDFDLLTQYLFSVWIYSAIPGHGVDDFVRHYLEVVAKGSRWNDVVKEFMEHRNVILTDVQKNSEIQKALVKMIVQVCTNLTEDRRCLALLLFDLLVNGMDSSVVTDAFPKVPPLENFPSSASVFSDEMPTSLFWSEENAVMNTVGDQDAEVLRLIRDVLIERLNGHCPRHTRELCEVFNVLYWISTRLQDSMTEEQVNILLGLLRTWKRHNLPIDCNTLDLIRLMKVVVTTDNAGLVASDFEEISAAVFDRQFTKDRAGLALLSWLFASFFDSFEIVLRENQTLVGNLQKNRWFQQVLADIQMYLCRNPAILDKFQDLSGIRDSTERSPVEGDTIDLIIEIFQTCNVIRSSDEWSLFVDCVNEIKRPERVSSPSKLISALDSVIQALPQFYGRVYLAMLDLLIDICRVSGEFAEKLAERLQTETPWSWHFSSIYYHIRLLRGDSLDKIGQDAVILWEHTPYRTGFVTFIHFLTQLIRRRPPKGEWIKSAYELLLSEDNSPELLELLSEIVPALDPDAIIDPIMKIPEEREDGDLYCKMQAIVIGWWSPTPLPNEFVEKMNRCESNLYS